MRNEKVKHSWWIISQYTESSEKGRWGRGYFFFLVFFPHNNIIFAMASRMKDVGMTEHWIYVYGEMMVGKKGRQREHIGTGYQIKLSSSVMEFIFQFTYSNEANWMFIWIPVCMSLIISIIDILSPFDISSFHHIIILIARADSPLVPNNIIEKKWPNVQHNILHQTSNTIHY